MKPSILIRPSLASIQELKAAENHFPVYHNRCALPQEGQIVIPRYSIDPPHAKEFYLDMGELNVQPINQFFQHLYCANIWNWVEDLQDLTPKTFRLDEIPHDGKFVLKGLTNSLKWNWGTHMYADSRKQAIEVATRIQQDSYVGQQTIVAREYIPLNNLTTAPQGLPISEEYRFFFVGYRPIGSGFYWSGYEDQIDPSINLDPAQVPEDFLKKVAIRIAPNCKFWVADIARTLDNNWIVVEINDGQCSGLCGIDPETLYQNLHSALD